MAAPIVLMLDGDVGFMFAVAHELSSRGITAYPARTVPEARLTMKRFRLALDVLVIDCAVPDACPFAEAEAEQLRNLAVVGLVSARPRVRRMRPVVGKDTVQTG